jgi:hypothetical protein
VHDEHRPFRGNARNFIDLIRTGKELGVSICVVAARDVKLSSRRVRGFVYNTEKKVWSEQSVPLPAVLYNRIPTRKDELQPDVQQTIAACLKHPQVRLFNPAFFNKFTLFEWLGKAKTTKKFIPATKKLMNPIDLESLLMQHSNVYLKPVRGKAGKGIMRIERQSLRGRTIYMLNIQSFKKSHISSFSTLTKLWAETKKRMGSEEYIVQQGITLSSFNRRPFDLRVLVQKDAKGEWGLTGIGARVAGKKSITTHVPRGGSIDEPEKLLGATFGAEAAQRILQRTRLAAFAIARQIEKASGHTLGEMSMDLGVDMSGQIWFFEANSRPMKFDEPDIRKKSLERIVQYSQYLMKTRKMKDSPVPKG